jgi:hypothetical protein
VTVKVSPSIVIAPVRAAPVLASTVNVAAPLPVAVSAFRIIQLLSLNAFHLHPAGAVTFIWPLPPSCVKDPPCGAMLKEQA